MAMPSLVPTALPTPLPIPSPTVTIGALVVPETQSVSAMKPGIGVGFVYIFNSNDEPQDYLITLLHSTLTDETLAFWNESGTIPAGFSQEVTIKIKSLARRTRVFIPSWHITP